MYGLAVVVKGPPRAPQTLLVEVASGFKAGPFSRACRAALLSPSQETLQIWAASEENVRIMPGEMYIGDQGREWVFQSDHGAGN